MDERLFDLTTWTYETVESLVTTYPRERSLLDYKAVLRVSRGASREEKEELLDSIRGTACSMANTDGGLMVFGVLDPLRHPGMSPQQLIEGVPLHDDHPKHLRDKLAKEIEPEIAFDPIPAPLACPHLPDRAVFVARIHRSLLRPHIYRGTFYKRTSGGTSEAMTIVEVREQMLNTEERLRKLTLLRIEMVAFRVTAEAALEKLGQNSGFGMRFDTATFKLLLADVSALVADDVNFAAGLVRLAMIANMVNQQLDTLQPLLPGNDPDPSRRAAQTNVAHISSICRDSEEVLAARFGPLPLPENLGVSWK